MSHYGDLVCAALDPYNSPERPPEPPKPPTVTADNAPQVVAYLGGVTKTSKGLRSLSAKEARRPYRYSRRQVELWVAKRGRRTRPVNRLPQLRELVRKERDRRRREYRKELEASKGTAITAIFARGAEVALTGCIGIKGYPCKAKVLKGGKRSVDYCRRRVAATARIGGAELARPLASYRAGNCDEAARRLMRAWTANYADDVGPCGVDPAIYEKDPYREGDNLEAVEIRPL